MAIPSFCTSRGARCLKTSAAPSSPSDSNRMAPRSTPSSFIGIGGYPFLDYIGHQSRLITRQLLGCIETFFMHIKAARYGYSFTFAHTFRQSGRSGHGDFAELGE